MKSMGSRTQILPRQMVPTSTRKMSPVGIEISSVVSMNGPARVGAQPLTNMWWAQTRMLNATNPMIPTTAIFAP